MTDRLPKSLSESDLKSSPVAVACRRLIKVPHLQQKTYIYVRVYICIYSHMSNYACMYVWQEAFHVPLVGKFLDKTIKYNGNAINQITNVDNKRGHRGLLDRFSYDAQCMNICMYILCMYAPQAYIELYLSDTLSVFVFVLV